MTEKNAPSELHGQFDVMGGSFGATNGSAGVSCTPRKVRFWFSGEGFHTLRYLDPPVLATYTNRATAGGFSASYERDFSDRDHRYGCD